MKYVIPKEVRVGNRVYDVKKVYTFGKACIRGKVKYDKAEILIADNGYAVGAYSPKKQFDTYWHELTHAILFEMGHELFNNEKFVASFADKLAQSMHTAKL